MLNPATQQQIDYHSARAIEEHDSAEQALLDVERRPHMELSRLHLYQAERLRGTQPDASSSAMAKRPLDMGEASREEGFRKFGGR